MTELQQSLMVDDLSARERLISSAIDLFAEKGYSATSVREIVERAGVTKPVLYYYFRNKEGLFQSIVEYAVELHRQVYAEALQIQGSARSRLEHLLKYVLSKTKEHLSLVKLIYSLVLAPTQDAPVVPEDAFIKTARDALVQIYQEGVHNGELKEQDPDVVACLFMSILDFSVINGFTNPNVDHSNHFLNMLRLVFTGLDSRKLNHDWQ